MIPNKGLTFVICGQQLIVLKSCEVDYVLNLL